MTSSSPVEPLGAGGVPDDRSTRPRRPTGLTVGNVALTAGVAVLLHLPALIRRAAINSDEATIGTVARVVRHGGSLYRDIVDRKPPGAFMLYRVLEPVFGTWTLTAGRWVALTATVAAMWILAIEATRRWPGVPTVGAALLGVAAFSLLPAEDSRAVGFELLATLPAVAAFVLGARRRTVLAGICVGIAALFKQPMLLGALPLAVQCLTDPEPSRQDTPATPATPATPSTAWSRRVLRLCLAGLATVITVLAGLAPFGLRDALSWFAGTGDNYLGGTELSTVVIVGLEQIGSVIGLTMGLSLLAAIAWRRRRIPLDLAVWFIASLLATAIGLRFILHYFNQLLPPLILLASPALMLSSTSRRLFKFALVWFGGALAFSMWTVLYPNLFHDLPDVNRVAAEIASRTHAGERIFVWGQAPEIYWVSNRDPAARYPHIGFITGVTPKRPGVAPYLLAQPEAAANLLADLIANRPALIVDAAIESVRGGDRYPLRTSPIAEFVEDNYCEVAVVDGMRLLEPCNS